MTQIQSYIDFQAMIDQSPLVHFQVDVPKKIGTRSTYDYAFELDDTIIYMMVEACHIEDIYQDIDQQRRAYVHLTHQLLKRHQKTLGNITEEHHARLEAVDKQHPEVYNPANLPKVYFVGLAGVSGVIHDTIYSLDYGLNSAFFHDECVFDLDNQSTLMQVFSLNDWQRLLDFLPSPSDLLAFLKYHRQSLVEQTLFDDSPALAQSFLHSPMFFQRAWQVEQHLKQHDLLVHSSSFIQETSDINQLVAQQTTLSPLWNKLIEGLIARQQSMGGEINWWVIRTLLLQSGYTRMKILASVLAQQNATFGQKQEGMVRHEHSYHRFGYHFAVVIYGQHPSSDLHPEQIYATYKTILNTLDDQIYDKDMQGLFLLGFDLSKTDEQGNIQVMMDVYYQPSRFFK